jgi:hypothetical protein
MAISWGSAGAWVWTTNPSSQFRFPTSLGPLGTGTGKFSRATIKCRDREPIKLRDQAYSRRQA